MIDVTHFNHDTRIELDCNKIKHIDTILSYNVVSRIRYDTVKQTKDKYQQVN